MNDLYTFVVLYGCGVLLSEATTKCNCKAGCDRDHITRCRACQDGWYGPYCQKRNVALGGTATQQGAYSDYTAELAVDGNTDTNFSYGSCTHTDDRYNAWWSVRLRENGVTQIKYMTIYNRKNKKNAHRRNGMEILVDGVHCKKWPDNVTPPVVDHVTCDSTLTGSNLTIRVRARFFTLCEVQVFVCSDFWFGEDCDKQCNCLHSDDVCDKVSGSCRRGCQLGFTGGDCQTECDDGQYGLNYASQCGHCLNNAVCNKTDGRCPGGCTAGWREDRCDECKDGQYGLNCASQCGHCLNNTVCDKTDGRCPGGCSAGWENELCNEECKDGRYGLNCASQCGHCLNNTVCDKTDGHCPGGCSAGWENELCNEVIVSTCLSLLLISIICTAVLVLIIIGATLLGLNKYGRIQCMKDPVKEGRQKIEMEEMNPTQTNNDYATLDSGTMSENKEYETIQQHQYGNI